MKMIPYKQEFFDLVSRLTSLDVKILVDAGERTVIKRQNEQETMTYVLSVPREYFCIDEPVGFYDFDEFYKTLKTFNPSEIAIENNTMVLLKDSSKFTYLLNDASRMKAGPNRVNFDSYDYKFDLDSNSLMELVKMGSLIRNSKYTGITCVGDEVHMNIHTEEADNSYQKIFDAERQNDNYLDEPLSVKIFSDFLELVPSRQDYTVYIKSPGYIKFELKSDDIDLCLFTSKVRPRRNRRDGR